jgi:hypothetical protein
LIASRLCREKSKQLQAAPIADELFHQLSRGWLVLFSDSFDDSHEAPFLRRL